MKFWCTHNWKVFSLAHTQPDHAVKFSTQGPEGLKVMELLIEGATHVVQRCAECGTFRQHEFSGVHQVKLEWPGEQK